ncbi:hypothetical protein [Nocardia albiluteola]|uniref:hypothetical protein n=1 Tax=Nocardia albiluteola TaxID=2842303 RepID=UPI001FD9AF0F|nr:hypothetical protein [Nocardia albiluteola]
MESPDSPLTYDEALRKARGQARDPDNLIHYRHEGLENARYGRGFAFAETIRTDGGDIDAYVLVTATAYNFGILWEGTPTIDAAIAEHLAQAEHVNRHIPDSELSVLHQVALEAFDTGLARIDEFPLRRALNAEQADFAEFILLVLRRNRTEGDNGRRILARHDFLLEGRTPGRRYTQPCPRCGQPTTYQERYPLIVCDQCQRRATDHTGRGVTGFNIDMSGGMIAYYSDTVDAADGSRKEECVEVTRTGECLIDGQPAIMQEARFGGILVQMAHPPEPPARQSRVRRLLRWSRR